MDNQEIKLAVRNLKISFRTDNGKVQAVRGIDFDLKKGETLAIVGESGSGKSVTNRAIMGILANNAIKEGGEIIYDGQDLMKIAEEDFHKLRGDKIAMIFQDPMSSLNPIMRVGKQMTEATLIKGKISQKESRKEFNEKLALLNVSMDNAFASSDSEKKAENKRVCDAFNKFEYKHLDLEYSYNKAKEAVDNTLDELDDILLRVEKKSYHNVRRDIGEIIKLAAHSCERYVVYSRAEELKTLLTELKKLTRISFGEKIGIFMRSLFNRGERRDTAADADWDTVLKKLLTVKEILTEAVGYTKPNFFAMGFYLTFSSEPLPDMPVEELNVFLRKYLDDHFMLHFISLAKKGVEHSAAQSIENKKQAIRVIDKGMEYFKQETIEKNRSLEILKEMTEAVEKAIDKLDIVKDNVLYIFASSLKAALDIYFEGIIRNEKEEIRYARQIEKYNRQVASGKTLNYKVAEKDLVNLSSVKKDILHVIERARDKMERDIAHGGEVDFDKKVVDLIDYLKEKASAVVFKVTPRMAKIRALKLLEEVGISEPRKRYRQYPFEFSGGMRQRIVIAIALSANPDILICDEPTTALDVTIQSQILELINKVKEERNLSVIFITHDLGVVANMADRVAVMYAGKIVEIGTANDIFYSPAHPYTWALLSSMPDLDTKEKLEAIPGTPPNMIYPPKGDAFAERNKYALQIDFEQEPPMFPISETHYAATWLLHPDAPKVDPPKTVVERINRMKQKANQGGGDHAE